MSIRLGLFLASAITVCGLVVACSDDNTGTTGSSSGTTSSSGNNSSGSSGNNSSSGDNGSSGSSGSASDACKIPPGTYTAKYTTKPGGTGPAGGACTDLPESSFEIKESSDGGTAQPQDGCTIETDEAACKVTSKCVVKNAGYTTTSETVMTTKDGKATGSMTSKTVKDDDGSVLSDCSYDFEWTKK